MLLAFRSAVWTVLFPGLFAFYVPWRFFRVADVQIELRNPIHLIGLLSIGLGATLLGTCIYEFASSGRGTLSPVDPPRVLVVRGLYRYVRNPMYLSVSLIVLGEVLLTRSRTLLAYWGVWFAVVNIFVLGYEEPTLRRQFGADYDRYRRQVGRWLPRFTRLVLLGTLLAILRGSASAGAAEEWTVYLRRAGPARIGMSISEVRLALGDQKASLAFTGPEPDDSECAFLQSQAVPKPLGLMFQKGRLVRIDVRAPGIRTASGAAVGDAEERIKQIYNRRISVGPHPYLDKNGHYVTFLPADEADREYGMVFETKDGRVTSFRTGTREAVALKEGCS